MIVRWIAVLASLLFLGTGYAQLSDQDIQEVTGWSLQDAARITAAPAIASMPKYAPQGWYPATVPGTVLTTLVDNKVYPEPLYGENMRLIPESLNKATYWYRTTLKVPAAYKGRQVWLHFGGINYAAQVWVNGHQVGSTRGAFVRGDFDVTDNVKPGAECGCACGGDSAAAPGRAA